jgi:hypothetical protein
LTISVSPTQAQVLRLAGVLPRFAFEKAAD